MTFQSFPKPVTIKETATQLWARYRKNKRTKPVKTIKRKKRILLLSIPKLKKKAWTLMSIARRKPYPRCVSCVTEPTVQAGHYIKKSICNLIFQYMEENVHGQGIRCNIFLHGNPVEYRKFMIKTYGEEKVKWMEENYNKPLPMNFNPREFIQSIIDKYDIKKA